MTAQDIAAGYFRVSKARDDMKAPDLYRKRHRVQLRLQGPQARGSPQAARGLAIHWQPAIHEEIGAAMKNPGQSGSRLRR